MFRVYGANGGYPARDEYGLVDEAALTPNRRVSALLDAVLWPGIEKGWQRQHRLGRA